MINIQEKRTSQMSDIDIKTEYCHSIGGLTLQEYLAELLQEGSKRWYILKKGELIEPWRSTAINESYVHEKDCRTGSDYRPNQYEGDS